jgi:probable HAF family extracellular repeat protein
MVRFGHVIAVIAIVWGLSLVSRIGAAASPPTSYTLTDLGTLPGNSSTAYYSTGLNSSGQVCGFAVTNRPFLWTPTTPNGTSGSLIDLGDLPTATASNANGINDYGQVVGFSQTHNAPGRISSAFLWTPNKPGGTAGSMTDISKATGSGDIASSINALGQVAGETAGGSAESLWTPTAPNGTTGSMTFPGTLPGTEESFPGKINVRGQIPGSSYGAFTDGLYHANLWSPTTPNGTSGTMIDLSDLPGGSNQSYANSVNDAGKVVGAGTTATAQHASLWTPTTPNGTTGSLTDLQSLVSSSNDSEAYDINNSDLIVGWSEISNNIKHATLWTADGPVDLNSLIDQPIGGPVGSFVLTSANDINDLGQIVCDAAVGGSQHVILLTPVGLPEPGSITLLSFAAILALRRRRYHRG